MAPIIEHLIEKAPPPISSNYGGGLLINSILNSKELLKSSLTNLDTDRNPANILTTSRPGVFTGSRMVQSSATLMPPDCVTADSTNELLRKICEILEPDHRSSTEDHVQIDSGWSVVIGGIIFFTLFMLVVAMINKTFSTSAKRGGTCKSIDRPSTCEEPFDMSYQFEKSLPPGEVKFQLCPGSDEDDWTDSFCRKEYQPLVHVPNKKKQQTIYNTF